MADVVRQLPRGRHGLAREEVAESQRSRLAVAVVDAVAEYGYYGTTVAHIVRGARVSRETFYDHFTSKDACFHAAVETLSAELGGLMEAAITAGGEPMERVDELLRAYFDWLVGHPNAARCLLLELRNAGPAMAAETAEAARRLGAMVADAMGIDPFDGEVFGAAVTQLVAVRLDAGRIGDLPGLREPLMALARRYAAASETLT